MRTGVLCGGLCAIALTAAGMPRSQSKSLLPVMAVGQVRLGAAVVPVEAAAPAEAAPHLSLCCEEVQGAVGGREVGLGLQEAADVCEDTLQDGETAGGGGSFMVFDDRPLETRRPVRKAHAFIPLKL